MRTKGVRRRRIPKNVTIYVLVDPCTDEIRYVGKTTQPLNKRLAGHICERGDKNHKAHWIKNLKRRGLTPIIREVEKVPDSCWQKYERYWIKFYRSKGQPLTNLTPGGDGVPITEEIRCKLAEAARNISPEHRRNFETARSKSMLGRKHSEESKRKTSLKLMGHVVSEETRKKISDALRSRGPLKDTTKRKLSEAHKGRPKSEETKRRISLAKRGIAYES